MKIQKIPPSGVFPGKNSQQNDYQTMYLTGKYDLFEISMYTLLMFKVDNNVNTR